MVLIVKDRLEFRSQEDVAERIGEYAGGILEFTWTIEFKTALGHGINQKTFEWYIERNTKGKHGIHTWDGTAAFEISKELYADVGNFGQLRLSQMILVTEFADSATKSFIIYL